MNIKKELCNKFYTNCEGKKKLSCDIELVEKIEAEKQKNKDLKTLFKTFDNTMNDIKTIKSEIKKNEFSWNEIQEIVNDETENEYLSTFEVRKNYWTDEKLNKSETKTINDLIKFTTYAVESATKYRDNLLNAFDKSEKASRKVESEKPKETVKENHIERALYLLNIAKQYLENLDYDGYMPDSTINYDMTDCDGFCLIDDIKNVLELINEENILNSKKAKEEKR